MKEQKQKEQYPKEQYQIGAIAHIVTDFSSKFGIPRQSGLVEELEEGFYLNRNMEQKRR